MTPTSIATPTHIISQLKSVTRIHPKLFENFLNHLEHALNNRVCLHSYAALSRMLLPPIQIITIHSHTHTSTLYNLQPNIFSHKKKRYTTPFKIIQNITKTSSNGKICLYGFKVLSHTLLPPKQTPLHPHTHKKIK